MSDSEDNLESIFPVKAMILISFFLRYGIKEIISSVSPEYENINTMSFSSIIPISPWIASLG